MPIKKAHYENFARDEAHDVRTGHPPPGSAPGANPYALDGAWLGVHV